MNPRPPSDLAASRRDRLRQLARSRNEDFQITLVRYAVERFLYRLSRSRHQPQFILKGAMLFTAWGQNPHRPTRDLDLLGRGNNDAGAIRETITAILGTSVEADGLEFDLSSLRVEPLHEGQNYEGVRASVTARLGTIQIPLQIDIAFGQAVEPNPEEGEYPALLGDPTPRLQMYPREVVVAEKLQAIVALGVGNSRLKDFFDLAFIAGAYDFEASRLVEALKATFDRRRTPLPESAPLALTAAYFNDSDRLRDWRGFTRRAGLGDGAMTLEETCRRIEAFVMPAVHWARSNRTSNERWPAGGGWHSH